MHIVNEIPDTDKIPNLVIQLRKSLDLAGTYPITFHDGTKRPLPTEVIIRFLSKYEKLKPLDREEMQNLAIKSIDAFMQVLTDYQKPAAPDSIYVK